MNSSFVFKSIVAAGVTVCSMASAPAQVVTTSHVLYGNARCDHVIHLMHMHGVNNSVDRSGMTSMFHHSRFGPAVVPDAELGDLEIVHVNQVSHDDPACGPLIAIAVKNNSCRDVCNFHVSAVAIFGRICAVSPNATVKIDQILSGEVLEVQIQLPIEALAMGNRNGQVLGFQRLVVAIDSHDVLLETNEANNLQAFDVASLPIVAPVVTEEVIESVSTETSVTETTATVPTEQVQVTDASAAFATNNVQPAVPENTDAISSAIERLGAGAETTQ